MTLEIVILAAGMGTRLGTGAPKCLTVLDNGETIMGRQLRNIQAAFGPKARINVVVGYKFEQIMETFRDNNYIYNEAYDMSNTSKSLLRALRSLPKGHDVLWMNGDVVFDEALLPALRDSLDVSNMSTVVTTTASVAEEEVKYTVNDYGYINAISKEVPVNVALGEAVGINYVAAEDRLVLERELTKVNPDAYFEKGIENSIREHGVKFAPFDITLLGLNATEVDFAEDLVRANATLTNA